MTSFSHKRLTTPVKPSWCPGCGNFGIWTAFKDAAEAEDWNNSNTVMVAGVGCHGHIVNFVKLTAFEGLHGRPIPVASGIKLANQRLNVFVFTGDGDCLSEGGNHFLHAARRNQDITVILHDNAIYGLTTGQTSPRSPREFRSKSTPAGSRGEPLHPLRLAITAGATFAARWYAGDIAGLTELMVRANRHKGFAVIDVLQPCVTFNKVYTHMYYQRHIYELDKSHDKSDYRAALDKTCEWEERIPVGVFYEASRPTYEEQMPAGRDKPLAGAAAKRDIGSLLAAFQ